jgi:predicted CoA-binding protein
MNVAVIGASNDRSKFGNKAVRAYLSQSHAVYPVNPREATIEGQTVYRSILDVPVDVDVTLVYLPPHVTIKVLDEIARKGTGQLFLNPGSEDSAAVEHARDLGLEPILACSIIAIGEIPASYGP